jgi:hypothetical protein
MKSLLHAFVLAGALIVAACATSPRTNRLSIGMTKQEVISVMGQPVSTAAYGKTELLRYSLSTPNQVVHGLEEEYFVRLVDGQVESYGMMGDFDSAREPALHLEK